MSNSQCNRDGRPATSSALLESSRESWPIARRSKTSRACRACRGAARAVAARRALDSCRVGDRRAAATATETTRWAGVWPSRRARARRANRAPRGREGDDCPRGRRGRRRRYEARRRRGVARAAGVVAVKLAPATCRARRTAAICVRAMAHAALAGVLVADGPMIAREAAASALTSPATRRSGPERAPRRVLSDLRERGFDADLARLANGGDIRATAVVRSARGSCPGRSCRGRGGHASAPFLSFPLSNLTCARCAVAWRFSWDRLFAPTSGADRGRQTEPTRVVVITTNSWYPSPAYGVPRP